MSLDCRVSGAGEWRGTRCGYVGAAESGGVTLREGIVATGAGEGVSRAATTFVAFFELHIEQGPVLEAQGRDVGVVTHIAGIRRLALTFKGQAAHAGTTPLDLRQDALVAAARFLLGLRSALESRSEMQPFVIGTVGEIHVAPNAPNVVPGEARVVVDLRSDASEALVAWTDRIRALGEQAVAGTRGDLGRVPVVCRLPSRQHARPALTAHLREAARELGLRQQDIVSGGGA